MKKLDTEKNINIIIKEFTDYVALIGKEYNNKVNENLIVQTSKDSQKRYEAIEKNFPICQAAKAKEILCKFNEEVA